MESKFSSQVSILHIFQRLNEAKIYTFDILFFLQFLRRRTYNLRNNSKTTKLVWLRTWLLLLLTLLLFPYSEVKAPTNATVSKHRISPVA